MAGGGPGQLFSLVQQRDDKCSLRAVHFSSHTGLRQPARHGARRAVCPPTLWYSGVLDDCHGKKLISRIEAVALNERASGISLQDERHMAVILKSGLQNICIPWYDPTLCELVAVSFLYTSSLHKKMRRRGKPKDNQFWRAGALLGTYLKIFPQGKI
jgi:hypothetical protein